PPATLSGKLRWTFGSVRPTDGFSACLLQRSQAGAGRAGRDRREWPMDANITRRRFVGMLGLGSLGHGGAAMFSACSSDNSSAGAATALGTAAAASASTTATAAAG